MKHIEIKSYKNGTTLYTGLFPDERACLEAAIQDNVALHYADLRSLNLSNANLDEGDLICRAF